MQNKYQLQNMFNNNIRAEELFLIFTYLKMKLQFEFIIWSEIF